jgi:hypothetical protein
MQDKTNEIKDTNELEVMNYLSKGDKFVFYIFRKISKVSYAVYAITDLIKDTEPLKWTLRKTASDMSALRNFFDEKSVFNNLERTLLELESFLELSSFAKVVSEMNARLLQSEIRKMIGEMRERSKEGFYSPELVASFFDIPKPEVFTIAPISRAIPPVENTPKEEDDYKGHKGQDVRYDFYKNTEKAPMKKAEPAVVEEKRKPEIKIQTENNKGQRRGEILDIIKRVGRPVSIKEITDRIKGCSEKTIQRELVTMVSDSTLKKTGERRWSMYSLK